MTLGPPPRCPHCNSYDPFEDEPVDYQRTTGMTVRSYRCGICGRLYYVPAPRAITVADVYPREDLL